MGRRAKAKQFVAKPKAKTENHFKTQFHFTIANQNIKFEIIHLISLTSVMTDHVKGQ